MNHHRSSQSIMSFGTNKSSLSKMSRKSQMATADAIAVSQATAQAAQAAKAILNAGGSELTALKTAKAAAVSALMPDSPHDDMSHGIGSSFLRRRKLKRQADVVASMALASAMAGTTPGPKQGAVFSDWDQESRTTLQGLKLINEQKGETFSTKSSSCPPSEDDSLKSNGQRRSTPVEMISQQFKFMALSNSFSGASSKSDRQSGDEMNQQSSSQESDELVYSPNDASVRSKMLSPQNLLGRNFETRRFPNRRSDKRALFNRNSDCLGITYSADDESIISDNLSTIGPVDSMLISMANAITSCAPMFGGRHHTGKCTAPFGGRVRNSQVSHMDDIDEDDFEDTITFDDESEFVNTYNSTIIVETDQRDDVEQSHTYHCEEREVEISMEASASVDESECTSDDILRDLMNAAANQSSANLDGSPGVLSSPDRNTIELLVPKTSQSVDDLSMSGASSGGSGDYEEGDENANYVQIVTPAKRSRRLARGYMKGSASPEEETPEASASKGVKSLFRKKAFGSAKILGKKASF